MENDDYDYEAVPFSRIKAQKLRYVWEPWIPRGLITVLTGESGGGKSTVMMDVIARLTRGWPMPQIGDDPEQSSKGSVLIACQEDPADTVLKPRLRAAGADMDRVHLMTIRRPGHSRQPEDHLDVIERLDVGIEKLERMVLRLPDVRLIFIDPITAFLGRLDFNREDHVRRLLRPIATLATKYKIAVVIVIHMNKDTNKKANQRILGSGGFIGANRSTLFVVAPDSSDRRLLVQSKSNIRSARDLRKAVEFKMMDVEGFAKIEWGADYEEVNLNLLLAGRGVHVSKQHQAAAKLYEWLSEGPRRATEVQQLSLSTGFHWNTFKAAKKEMGITSFNRDGVWWWRLDQGDKGTRIQRERL